MARFLGVNEQVFASIWFEKAHVEVPGTTEVFSDKGFGIKQAELPNCQATSLAINLRKVMQSAKVKASAMSKSNSNWFLPPSRSRVSRPYFIHIF
jgi:hypothetical protein